MPTTKDNRIQILKTGIETLGRIYSAVAENPGLIDVEIFYRGEVTGNSAERKDTPRDPQGVATIYPLSDGKRIYGVRSTNRNHVAQIDLGLGRCKFQPDPVFTKDDSENSGYGTGELGRDELDIATYKKLWYDSKAVVQDVMERKMV